MMVPLWTWNMILNFSLWAVLEDLWFRYISLGLLMVSGLKNSYSQTNEPCYSGTMQQLTLSTPSSSFTANRIHFSDNSASCWPPWNHINCLFLSPLHLTRSHPASFHSECYIIEPWMLKWLKQICMRMCVGLQTFEHSALANKHTLELMQIFKSHASWLPTYRMVLVCTVSLICNYWIASSTVLWMIIFSK